MVNLLLSFLFIFFIQVNPITGMVINIKELKDAMEVYMCCSALWVFIL